MDMYLYVPNIGISMVWVSFSSFDVYIVVPNVPGILVPNSLYPSFFSIPCIVIVGMVPFSTLVVIFDRSN